MATTYVKRDLYGGAMSVELPSSLMDVSDLRPVPDNQEVFVDKDGLASVIVDLLEPVTAETTGISPFSTLVAGILKDPVGSLPTEVRVNVPNPDDQPSGFETAFAQPFQAVLSRPADYDAFVIHIRDIEDTDQAANQRLQEPHLTIAEAGHMPPDTTVLSARAISHPKQLPSGGVELTCLLVVLFRLRVKPVDIVVTINVPHGQNDTAGHDPATLFAGPLMQQAEHVKDSILRTLVINDYSLFDA